MTLYAITGDVSIADRASASEGETVTLTNNGTSGGAAYVYLGQSDEGQEYATGHIYSGGSWSFTMPASDVFIRLLVIHNGGEN